MSVIKTLQCNKTILPKLIEEAGAKTQWEELKNKVNEELKKLDKGEKEKIRDIKAVFPNG